ncbi:meteorin-like protein [Uloborus diversus]|uniref:meteorin-like protein n=1 Tax=Uloborus diversus TaxID=327109 RepID=UPI00240A565B|nr:meteorin-like protein [Uloborus diversus]
MMRILRTMVVCVIFSAAAVTSGPTSDDCDWTGSGTPDMALSRGVRPVYLRCNQGKVRWSYPQGALRIVLQHRPAGKEFVACVRRSNGSSGARIYVAGRKKLHRVFSPRDALGLVKCVASQRGQVALYVEADPVTDALRRATSEFSYHLKRRTGRSIENDVDDCRPCSEEQLLRQYCSSDFVIQGEVASLFHNKPLQTTELTVRVSHVHRTNEQGKFSSSSDFSTNKQGKFSSSSDFSTNEQGKFSSSSDFSTNEQGKLSSSSDISTNEHGKFSSSSDFSSGLTGSSQNIVLHRPLHCGTKAGNGEYLFFGDWVLGYPNLYCVPRLVEWKKVRRKALRTGVSECLL